MCQCLHVVTYIHIRDMTLTHIRLLRKTTHIAMCSHLCAHLSCKRSDFISRCCSQRVLEALQHEISVGIVTDTFQQLNINKTMS